MRTHCSMIAVLLIASCLFETSYSVPQKPGTCPSPPIQNPMTLYCNIDQDCPEDEKCCMRRCTHPVAPIKRCPATGLMMPCIEQCSTDSQCKKGQICCYNGCGHQCMTIPVPP
ncbi:perlwapin-like [Nematolebias whitei]|uniref:perlwapin-like n=1 Tax=Nematolebias whitei TaxID=451745 RepID=UPI00189C5486|nr:perlwapin-like [Nematolebias whitei]